MRLFCAIIIPFSKLIHTVHALFLSKGFGDAFSFFMRLTIYGPSRKDYIQRAF